MSIMNLRDLIPDFTAFKSATNKALEDSKTALAERDKQLADLSAKLEALSKVKADDSTDSDDTSTGDSSDEPSLYDALVELLKQYAPDESDDSDTADDSDSQDDSTDDGSDDDNEAKAKASSKAHKAKVLHKLSKALAHSKEAKQLKESIPQLVARETQKVIAQIGIPAPIAVAPEGKRPLKEQAPDGSKRAHKLIRDGFNEDPAVAKLNQLLGRK